MAVDKVAVWSSRVTTLIEAARTPPSLTWCRTKLDFCKVKVPFYKNGHKFGLNLAWLERTGPWKRQKVSGMLFARWNEAYRVLTVLTLESNYLDRWPNDCFFFYATVSQVKVLHICCQKRKKISSQWKIGIWTHDYTNIKCNYDIFDVMLSRGWNKSRGVRVIWTQLNFCCH